MLRLFVMVVAVVVTWSTFLVYDFLFTWSGIKAVFGWHQNAVVIVCGGIAVLGAIGTWYLANDMVIWSLGATDLPKPQDLKVAIEPLLDRLMPKLGVKVRPRLVTYGGNDINAIVVSRTSRSTTIAISKGFLERADANQAEVLLSYCLAKIASGHGQMVLILQGLIMAFTLFPARMFALLLGTSLRTAEEETPSDTNERLLTAALELVLLPLNAFFTRLYCRVIQSLMDRQVVQLLGPEVVRETLNRLSEETEPQTFREAFALPHKFGLATMPRLVWLSYHRPYRDRANAIVR